MKLTPDTHIAVFGGTFNPPHLGHLRMAELAIEKAGMDGVLFVPSGNPYMKASADVAPKEHRFAMAQLMAEENPQRFQISDVEIQQDGPSYTLDTLLKLQPLYPDAFLHVLLGADNLMGIENWHEPEKLMQAAPLLIFDRAGLYHTAVERQAERLRQKYGAKIDLISADIPDISASDLRRRMRTGEDLSNLVLPSVLEYIRAHGLYLF